MVKFISQVTICSRLIAIVMVVELLSIVLTVCLAVLSCDRSSSGVESLWVSVRLGYFHPYSILILLSVVFIILLVLHRSVNDVYDNIEKMMLNKKYVVACGDFNINLLDLSKPLSESFQQFITSHSLIQPINVPTRYYQSSVLCWTSSSPLKMFLSLNQVFLTILSLTCLCFSGLTLPPQPCNPPSSLIVLSRTFQCPVLHLTFHLFLGQS